MYCEFASVTDSPAKEPSVAFSTSTWNNLAVRQAAGRTLAILSIAVLAAACASQPEVKDSGPPADDAVSQPAPAVESRPAPEPPAKAPPGEPPRREPPARRLTIAAVGDMMLGTDYPENRLPDDDAAGFLGEVAHWLKAADLTFGNLEGVLADVAEPAKECSNPSACYLFRSPTRYADRFLDAGFDGLSLANNHARDFGEEGRSETMSALAARGIAHSGRAGDFATLRWQGLDVAFLAFAVTRNSNLLHDYALAEAIVAEQAARHDVVIVSFHGGAEGEGAERLPFAEEWYFGEPRGDVVRFARSMVDAGADLVFGHGPHVVRGMEHYRNRLIAYSLGNFATYYGISVRGDRGVAPVLEVTVDERGRFIEGRIRSTVQVRPGGPQPDPEQRALALVRDLTRDDIRDPGLTFGEDGRLTATARRYVRPVGDGEAGSGR